MSLAEYDRKRDFARTSEPRGKAVKNAGAPIFVIQLHHARARHFDFRLQVGKALASWAVPKGPSLRAGEKRLAVQVEDHPLDYAGFEGVIPEGNYGAGDVRVVEQGTWECEGDPAKAIASGKLDFTLHGRHLKGQWKLIRTGRSGEGKQWLLMKRTDAHARDTDLDALIARGGKAVHAGAAASRRKSSGRKSLPAVHAVQLATLADKAPAGDDWLHEVKWDGYRLLARREGRTLHLASRNGTDWTGRFPDVERALLALPVASLVLDGELVVLDAQGRSDFAALQRRLQDGEGPPVSCIAFDLLETGGEDLTGLPQIQRKRLLEALLAKKPSPYLAYSQHIVGHGPQVFAASARQGLEGIVSKRVDAPYADGRSRHWLKVKHSEGTEAVVVGYTAPQKSRTGLGALMLALPEGDGWRYIGRVGTGMDDATLTALRRKLQAMQQTSPVLELPAHVTLPARSITWVRPGVVVEVAHRGWGKEGLLRHASFLRERLDKSMKAAPPPTRGKPTSAARDGVRLTSPEREVFHAPAITKQQVADYYRAVASHLLPGLVDRPLSVLRAPDGVPGETFFQKHGGPGMGDAVGSIDVREKSGKKQPYLAIRDEEGLLQLVQMNALEFHPWGAHPGRIEEPDRIVFDLDPGPGVDWQAMVAAARTVRTQLDTLGLESFPMLSGGKGVHVLVPIARGHGWDHAKSFAQAIAQLLSLREPDKYVATASKDQRDGRIFIDWLRNGRGATSIAAWSLRARHGAPVAMPVGWSELARTKAANQFTLAAALTRAKRQKKHPWGDVASLAQQLPVPP